MAKVMCMCCGQQILTPGCLQSPVKRLFDSQYVCSNCSKDLDQDGLFPEERAQIEFLDRIRRESNA